MSLLLMLISQLSFGAVKACWMNEENPRTKKPYASATEYNSDLSTWQNLVTPVNPLQLILAYHVYLQEKQRSLTLESDKMSHCYFGCRMRQRTNYQTVQYVAWLKELRDLKDCDPSSHFEVKDFEATVLGGGIEAPTAEDCVTTCRLELPKVL